MSNWITVVNFALPVAGLMIVLFGMVMTAASTFSDKATRRFLLLFFTVLALYLGCNLFSQIAELFLGNYLITHTAKFFEYIFSSLLLHIHMLNDSALVIQLGSWMQP